MPFGTVERVDCMVAEQYNFTHCEANPRFQRNDKSSLGIWNGARRHTGELIIFVRVSVMHRSQIFFFILLAFILGIFAGSFLNISKTVALMIAMVCAALIAIFYRRGSRMLNIPVALAAFFALFFVLGVLRFDVVNSRQQALTKIAEGQQNVVDPENRRPIKVAILGYIDDEPEQRGDKQRFAFRAKTLEAGPYLVLLHEKVMVTAQLYPEHGYGDWLRLYGQVKIPENFSEDFDYRKFLAKDDIFTTMFFPEISNLGVELLSKPGGLRLSIPEKVKLKVYQGIFSFKKAFEKSLARSVDEPNASFLGGILLGSRSQIPDTTKEEFSRTGTTHILAISGYNITLIATLISSFFLWFFKRQTAFWFSLAGVVMFTILTGAQASVVRASIMGILVLLARREGRLNDPHNAILLAGALMILVHPKVLRYDIGFQLSFMATLGLIYVAPIFEQRVEKITNFFKFRENFVATISAQLAVLPLLAYHFKNLSLVSLPANVLILPLIPYSMLAGFISGILGIIVPFLGQLVGYFAWLLSSIQLWIISVFAKPDWAVVGIRFGWYLVLLAYAVFVWYLKKLSTEKSKED